MKTNYFQEITSLLKELNKEFPSYTLGQHIATALDGYGDVWGMSDREFLFALTKYKTGIELDVPHIANDKDLEEIIKGGMNLFSNEEEEDY